MFKNIDFYNFYDSGKNPDKILDSGWSDKYIFILKLFMFKFFFTSVIIL